MTNNTFKPGDLYEDCGYVPRLCIAIDYDTDEMTGINLINGTIGMCSPHHCGPMKITTADVIKLRQDRGLPT